MGGADTDEVWGIVERGEVGEFLDGGEDVVVDDHGAGELFAAVYDAVAYGADLADLGDDAHFVVDESVEDEGHSLIVVGGVSIEVVGVAVYVMDEAAMLFTDTFDGAFGEDVGVRHIEELVLDGGTATVYH